MFSVSLGTWWLLLSFLLPGTIIFVLKIHQSLYLCGTHRSWLVVSTHPKKMWNHQPDHTGRRTQHLQPWESVIVAQARRDSASTRLPMNLAYNYAAYAGVHVVTLLTCELFWNRQRLRIHTDVHYSICAMTSAQLHNWCVNVHECNCRSIFHPALEPEYFRIPLWL